MKVVYTYIGFCTLVLPLYIVSANPKPKSGPYFTRAVRTSKCEHPALPYHDDPRGVAYAELYNTSRKQNLIRGNITMFKENPHVVLMTKNFYWYGGKWKLVYKFTNPGCHSALIKTIFRAYGVRKVNCSVGKGVYNFENIDINQLEHFWSRTKEYGRSLWRYENAYEGKTDACWETETIVIPAKSW